MSVRVLLGDARERLAELGLVADRLNRNAILIELNPAYADMAKRRIEGDAPLLAEVG